MKALVLKEYRHLEIQDVPPPDPAEDEVLIRVKVCGICGSDVHGMDGSTGRRIPPIIMGHEAAGVVERIGAKVTGVAPGDRVTFDSTIYCGRCRFCLRGRVNLCENRRVLGVSCGEYRRHGAFAEWVTVPGHIVYRIPDAVTFEQAALIEPLSVAVHAVDRVRPRLGDAAVVVGGGMIGQLVAQAARVAGCGEIVVIEPDEYRRELACKLGAAAAWSPAEASPQRLSERLGGPLAEIVFDAVGTAESLALALSLLEKGGTCGLVGNLAPQVPLPLQATVTREYSLLGCCASQADYPRCLNLLAGGGISVDPLISRTAPLDEGPKWFDILYHRREPLMKVLLAP
ncbi:galactitol-1-phosphate 5-dehydrogenase [Thermopirellula anaerolimosa]